MTQDTLLIQGPLAGYSSPPFRVLAYKWGKPDFACTEMLSVKTLLFHNKPQNRFTDKSPEEGKLCYQLSSNVPTELREAVKRVVDFGADSIDLNCGCPQPKIRNKNAGSKHLEKPKQLAELISAMREATNKPISIKIRIDPNNLIMNREIADIAESEGCDFLIVHGRHWTERYDTPCRLDPIADIVQHCNIPIIGNGDIECAESYKTMIKETGCKGVMICRASVGQPWLFEKIRCELAGEIFTPPNNKTIGTIFLEHVERAIPYETEKFAVIQARKLGKYYAKSLTDKKAFLDQLNTVENFPAFRAAIQQYFQ